MSDKPRDGYDQSRLWADDVSAVIRSLSLDQKAALPHAQVDVMADAGHAAFWDDAPAFNRRLAALCEGL